jgi:hypothetical protein
MTSNELEAIAQNQDILIYGAHTIAKGLYGILRRMGYEKQVKSFAVTDMRGNPSEICSVPVHPIAELLDYRETCTVIIALPEKFFGEVIQTLKENDFHRYKTFGLADCIKLLNQAALAYFDDLGAKVSVAEDPYDYSCLDVFPRELPVQAGTELTAATTHCKLAVLTGFPFDDKAAGFLREMDFFDAYESACGLYRNLKQLPIGGKRQGNADALRVYMASSHKDGPMPDSFVIPNWTIPVQGGSSLTESRTGALCDNSGDSISGKNADYAEMTVAYWAWKNAPISAYKGLCHYRRHFVIDEDDIIRLSENDIDALLTPARIVFPDVKRYFLEIPAFRLSDLDLMKDALSRKAPDYVADASRFFSGNYVYPNNMVIAKASVYDEYCRWVFGILFEMEEQTRARGIVRGDRYLAYAAELLTSIYFIHNRDDLKIAVTDYRFLG